MNKATGVYVWVVENAATEPTVFVAGEGQIDEGPVADTEIGKAEEGIITILVGEIAMQMVSLDCGEGSAHQSYFDEMDKRAKRVAYDLNKRLELVRFGVNGREHVKWYGPK